MVITFNGKTPNISENAFVADNAVIIGDVTIEDDASIWFGVVIRGDIAPVYIGKGTNIQDNTVVHVDSNIPCIIREYVTVGHAAIIHSATVEEHCLIGMGAVILTGAVVRKGSIVGAKALILEHALIEENSLTVGMPARTIRRVTEDEKKGVFDNTSHYIELSKEYIKTSRNIEK